MGPPLQGRECWVRSAGEGVVGPPCRGGSAGFALQGREWWVHPAGEGVVGPPCRGGRAGSTSTGREAWVCPAGEGVLGLPCRGGRGGSTLQGRERWVRPAGEGEVGPPPGSTAAADCDHHRSLPSARGDIFLNLHPCRAPRLGLQNLPQGRCVDVCVCVCVCVRAVCGVRCAWCAWCAWVCQCAWVCVVCVSYLFVPANKCFLSNGLCALARNVLKAHNRQHSNRP